jgi:hypothetical protein
MVIAIPASATKVHLFKETFGSVAQPSFTGARGIALDQSSGDLLVMDVGGTPSIKRFNPDGTPANFSALGTNAIDGKGNGECATVPADCDQTPQNGLGFAETNESQIAVDNSGTATDGNIYVTQNSPNAINVFSEEGEYLGQLTAAGATPFSEACGVAVDPAGAVYVGDFSGGIHKFLPAANPPVNADNTADFTTVTNPCTLAAGAGPTAGFLFAAKFGGPISKLDSATGEVKYVVSPDTNTTVSVDPVSGHVYAVTSGSSVKEFDASGAGSSTSITSLSPKNSPRSVAVRGSTADVYVSSGASKVEVFGPLVAVPTVVSTAPSNLDKNSFTLNGTVNPDGVALEECKFEYGLTTSYGETVPCAEALGAIGSGTSPVPVHADVSGLDVATVYHYRLVAKNENSLVTGTDKTAQTTGAVLADAWTDSVVRTEAMLKAKINPEGNATTYRIEWGFNTSYGNSTAEKGVGSDSTVHTVSTMLSGLAPNATYHWRVVATNSAAINVGPDLSFTTYSPVATETGCPNQAFRIGISAVLPDCRVYEMVSPIEKGGADIVTRASIRDFRTALNQASVTGDKITYSSYKAFGDAVSSLYSNQYIASRGAHGWTTHGISPAHESSIFIEYDVNYDLDTQFRAFTDDLSSAWLTDDADPPLTSDAVEGWINIYRRNNVSDTYEALTKTEPAPGSSPEEPGLTDAEIEGHSQSGSHAIFAVQGALTPDAALGDEHLTQLYDFTGGELRLVSVLPNDTASSQDAHVGNLQPGDGGFRGRKGDFSPAISDDGSRIFWTSGNKIYVRIDGERTVPVSESVTSKPADFTSASRDGSKAIFRVPTNGRPDLYEFDVDTEAATLIAHESYGTVGVSDDASYIYFISGENLASGATAGEPNLYLNHEGTTTFIANLRGEPSLGGQNGVSGYINTLGSALDRASRVTPGGHSIAFQSTLSLTGYDNTDAANGEPDLEVFHYDADTGQLTCASCNPSGARPMGQPLQRPFLVGDIPASDGDAGRRWTAAWLTTAENYLYSPRTLSDDGNRLFFNSFDALVPQDTNGAQDVYQWEAQGSGTCNRAGGCISLISTGQSPEISEFVDASPDGRDVFFSTSSSIDPRDPGLIDFYDARAGGGFQPPPAPAVPCVGDACQSVPAPPNDATPASAGFRGEGNPVVRKARRSCRARNRHAGKGQKSAQKKKAKRCKRAGRRAAR